MDSVPAARANTRLRPEGLKPEGFAPTTIYRMKMARDAHAWSTFSEALRQSYVQAFWYGDRRCGGIGAFPCGRSARCYRTSALSGWTGQKSKSGANSSIPAGRNDALLTEHGSFAWRNPHRFRPEHASIRALPPRRPPSATEPASASRSLSSLCPTASPYPSAWPCSSALPCSSLFTLWVNH